MLRVFPEEHKTGIFFTQLTSKRFKKFLQKIKLPPVGIEPITLTITGFKSLIHIHVLNKKSLN